MTTTTTAQWNLRVAVQKIRLEQQAAKYAATKKLAEGVYAPLRLNGSKSFTPVLPNGQEAGTIAVKAGTATVAFREDELLALVAECEPENVEEFVHPSALAEQRVIDLIRANFPQLVGKRVAAGRRSELEAACKDSDGVLVNTQTRKRVKVADIHRTDPSGEFAYIPGKAGTAAVLAALEAGIVTEDGDVVPPAAVRVVSDDGEILMPVAGAEPAAEPAALDAGAAA